MTIKIILVSFLITGFISCGEVDSKTNEIADDVPDDTVTELTKAGVNPPVSSADVPFMNVVMDAEQGGAFVSNYGSIIVFPANAVLNEDGTPVTGEFDVEYREFQDPLDIYFAGIPMGYDSAGVNYNFISAGMCELNAYQNGNKLKVNSTAPPEVQLVSRDSDAAHNLYYFDKSSNKWLNKGKSEITELTKESATTKNGAQSPSLPNKPVKKDASKHSFTVAIDKSEVSMSEFDGYDKMEFQIADEEKNYKPSDAKIHWTGVKVEKSVKYKGKYVVIFSSADITKSYLTNPVFSDVAYQKALSHYEKVLKQNKLQEDLAAKFNADFDQKQKAILKRNKIIDSINRETDKRNIEYELYYDSMVKVYEVAVAKSAINQKYNDSIAIVNKTIRDSLFYEQNEELKAYKIMMDNAKTLVMKQNAFTVNRGFAISNFGIWNCDNPMLASADVVVTTIDKKAFDPSQEFTVIYASLNSVFGENKSSFKNLKNTNEILLYVNGETLYYNTIQNDKTVVVESVMKSMDVSNISFIEIKKKLMGK